MCTYTAISQQTKQDPFWNKDKMFSERKIKQALLSSINLNFAGLYLNIVSGEFCEQSVHCASRKPLSRDAQILPGNLASLALCVLSSSQQGLSSIQRSGVITDKVFHLTSGTFGCLVPKDELSPVTVAVLSSSRVTAPSSCHY